MDFSKIGNDFDFNEVDFKPDISLKESLLPYIEMYIKKYESWLWNEWKICIKHIPKNEKKGNKQKNKYRIKRKLSENRILGLILLYNNISTDKIVEMYNKWFEELSRSTISNYLNGLYKEKILDKKKNGKMVLYFYNEEAKIKHSTPFWFTRNICPTPRYIYRIAHFGRIIYTRTLDKEVQYILKIIQLKLISNRFKKCLYCRFSNQIKINQIIKKVDDILSEKTNYIFSSNIKDLVLKFGELRLFNGAQIDFKVGGELLPEEIVNITKKYKKEINLQLEINKKIIEIRTREN